jgi:hypothetical protein
MTSENSNLKVSLLKNYLKPLSVLGNSEPLIMPEIKREISVFIDANRDSDIHEYLERARNKFGHWVEIADKSIMIDKISSMEAKMRYFFILSIVSVIIGVLAALATIK